MHFLLDWMTMDEWILTLLLVVIVFGFGLVPRLAKRLAGN